MREQRGCGGARAVRRALRDGVGHRAATEELRNRALRTALQLNVVLVRPWTASALFVGLNLSPSLGRKVALLSSRRDGA